MNAKCRTEQYCCPRDHEGQGGNFYICAGFFRIIWRNT